MKKKNSIKFDDFIQNEFEKDPELAKGFLELALREYQKDNDEKVLLIALGQVARAKKNGFSDLAKKTGLSRESLYKTLSPKGNPKFHTLKLILEALGYNILFQSL